MFICTTVSAQRDELIADIDIWNFRVSISHPTAGIPPLPSRPSAFLAKRWTYFANFARAIFPTSAHNILANGCHIVTTTSKQDCCWRNHLVPDMYARLLPRSASTAACSYARHFVIGTGLARSGGGGASAVASASRRALLQTRDTAGGQHCTTTLYILTFRCQATAHSGTSHNTT